MALDSARGIVNFGTSGRAGRIGTGETGGTSGTGETSVVKKVLEELCITDKNKGCGNK